MNSTRGFGIVVLFLAGLFAAGTIGFHSFEGYSYFESFYLSAATITTVGYGDLHPTTVPGRLLSVFLMLSGITAAASILGVSLNYFVEGGLSNYVMVRRMKRTVGKMEKHVIVCGYGDVGRGIVDILSRSEVPFVVIEQNPAVADQMRLEGIPVVLGDATTDKALLEAGVTKAQGLLTTFMDDTENLYIVLSARALCPTIRIVSRATSPRASDKLYKVGVDTVITLSTIGAQRMVDALVHPEVVGLMDILTDKGKSSTRLEAFLIQKGSTFEGMRIGDLRRELGAGVQLVAIKREQAYLANPADDTAIALDDALILWGDEKFFEKLDILR